MDRRDLRWEGGSKIEKKKKKKKKKMRKWEMVHDGLRLGMELRMGMTAKVDGSARYSLSCPLSWRLEDTLGPGDDDGGGVILHGGWWMLVPSVCGVPVSPLECLEGASASASDSFCSRSPPPSLGRGVKGANWKGG
jgi:hypothetical protein